MDRTYDTTRFRFATGDGGTRLVYRPGVVLVEHDGSSDFYERLSLTLGRRLAEQDGQRLPDRVITGDATDPVWGLYAVANGEDPLETVDRLRSERFTAQVDNIYFSGTRSWNRAAPNYAVPNYAVPNYAVPNYAVPNYAVAGGRCSCAAEDCPPTHGDPPEVPQMSARRARVPLAALEPTVADDGIEIHVLDVRPQLKEAIDVGVRNGRLFVNNLNDAYRADNKLETTTPLVERGGALLHEALFLADEIEGRRSRPVGEVPADAYYAELREQYIKEPFSSGKGCDVNGDGVLDPTTNHGEFIKGIIDRIVGDSGDASLVRLHSVMGTLGDVSDSELVKSMVHIDAKKAANKTHIMNLSLAGYPEVDDKGDCLAEQVEQLIRAGWTIVASAGNDGSCRPTRPASLPGVVSVAAYGPTGPAWFSNHGDWVDACAPGVDVVSDFPNIAVKKKLNRSIAADKEFATGFAVWSGTSFAAPFVAAMLARLSIEKSIKLELAIDQLIRHDDAMAYPGYGTIISYEITRQPPTQRELI